MCIIWQWNKIDKSTCISAINGYPLRRKKLTQTKSTIIIINSFISSSVSRDIIIVFLHKFAFTLTLIDNIARYNTDEIFTRPREKNKANVTTFISYFFPSTSHKYQVSFRTRNRILLSASCSFRSQFYITLFFWACGEGNL